MTGFQSKRQASKSLLEPQSARAIAEEQSYDAGLWFVATTVTEAHLQAALRRLTDAVECAPAEPNHWLDAVDIALICTNLATAESFTDAGAALDALISWHVRVALDPAVSAAAQALVDRGAAVAEPLTDEQILGAVARGWCHPRNKFKLVDPDIAIAIAAEVSALIDAHDIGINGSKT